MRQKNKKIITVICVICVLLLLRCLVTISALIKMRTCEPTTIVIDMLQHKDEIIEKCGNYISCNPVVRGGIYKYSVGPIDGKAIIEIKFTSENGDYFIVANLVENDDVWTISDYELVER